MNIEGSKIFKPFLYFLPFLLILISNAYGNQRIELDYEHLKEEKIYVNPNQIEITNHDIVIWLPNEKAFILAESLAFDDKGLYIIPLLERGPCGIHYRWCKKCGGCGVLLCPMNCTCYD